MRQFLAIFLVFIASAAEAARGSDVLISVNGTPITRAQALEATFRLHGSAVLREMVDDVLVRQAAASAKIAVDPGELEARASRFRSQFPDEAAFQERLAAQGSSPEDLRRRIELQLLREELVARERKITVSDAEIRRFYQDNKNTLGAPDAVRLRMILTSTEEESRKALAKIQAGADFAATAAELSIDPSKAKGGDMGFIPRGALREEAASQLFGKKPGTLVGPMKLEAGYSIFKVEEARPARIPPLAEIEADLRQAIRVDKVAKAWPEILEALHKKAKIETFD